MGLIGLVLGNKAEIALLQAKIQRKREAIERNKDTLRYKPRKQYDIKRRIKRLEQDVVNLEHGIALAEARISRAERHEAKREQIARSRKKHMREVVEALPIEEAPAKAVYPPLKTSGKFEETLEEEKAKFKWAGGWWLTPGRKRKIFLWSIPIAVVAVLIFIFAVPYLYSIFIGIFILLLLTRGFKIAITFAIIGIIVFAIFSTTTVGRAFIERTGISLTPLFEKFRASTVSAAERIESQITGVGEWRNPYAEEVKERKGIEITSIIPVKQNFAPGELIEIIGTGIVKALEEPTAVSFNGSMDNTSVSCEPSTIEIPAGLDIPFSARCKFENVATTENIEYKTVKFNAKYYNYKTWGRLRLYTLSKEEQGELGTADPFSYYEIKDNLLTQYRTTTSTYKFGPLKISMYVANRQPLAEGKYSLLVGVNTDKVNWEGNLAQGGANTMTLKFPKNADVKTEDCKKELKIKEGATYACDFEISSIEPGLSFIEIEAEAVYDYEFSKTGNVIIAKQGS